MTQELPWEAFTEDSFAGWWAIREKASQEEVGSGDGGFEEEDAQFIVTACNAHAGLVEALQAAKPWIGGLANENSSVVEVYEQLCAALAAAGVK